MNVNTLFEGIPTDQAHQKEYQSGVQYRSICAECNNVVLGACDPVYKEFSHEIAEIISSSIVVPQIVTIPVQINKLCRAVLGHMLVAKEFYDKDCLIDVNLREYVLGKISKPDVKLYYWIYPYSTVFNIRDVVTRGYNTEDPAIPQSTISVMASFPVAYMITESEDTVAGLHDLIQYTTDNIDDVVDIPIDFATAVRPGTNTVRHFAWPCNIGDEIAMVLAGEAGSEDSRLGVPRKTK